MSRIEPLATAVSTAAAWTKPLSLEDRHGLIDAIGRQDHLGWLLDGQSDLPALRSSLLQSRQMPTLVAILEALRSHALRLGEPNVADLARILLFNAHWHTGDLDRCQSIRSEIDALPPGPHDALFRVFVSFERHTVAQYRDSLSILGALREVPAGQARNAERFIGADLDLVIATWSIWNRIEALDYDGLDCDIASAADVLEGRRRCSHKTAALYALALGFFYLTHDAVALARRCLEFALNHAVADGGLWRPRILSALCLCEHQGGNVAASHDLLEETLGTLPRHFGPVGWMLNIVDALHRHHRPDEAKALLARAFRDIVRKGEVGNEIWCHVMALEIGPPSAAGFDAGGVFARAAALGMRRACRTLIHAGAGRQAHGPAGFA